MKDINALSSAQVHSEGSMARKEELNIGKLTY